VLELTQITVYPVKSCKGLTLTRASLTPFGLELDRRWMVVDANNTFVSQRSLPSMALIEPLPSDRTLRLKAPGMEDLEVSIPPTEASPRPVNIWEDVCAALDCGDGAARWFSQFLGTACRLVSIGTDYKRAVNPNYAADNDQVSFADAFPLLLISSASLRDLNARLDTPIPMNRFRPNIVVSGCDPYAEDQWQRVSIGPVTFRVSKPCARCTVPTVDQTTGIAGQEPLATLATYRKGRDGKVFFGQNMINEQKSGEIVLGSEVTILP
jgi:uncharacterized protein YcbX